MDTVTEIQRYLAAGQGEPYVRVLLTRVLAELRSAPAAAVPPPVPAPELVVKTVRMWEGQ